MYKRVRRFDDIQCFLRDFAEDVNEVEIANTKTQEEFEQVYGQMEKLDKEWKRIFGFLEAMKIRRDIQWVKGRGKLWPVDKDKHTDQRWGYYKINCYGYIGMSGKDVYYEGECREHGCSFKFPCKVGLSEFNREDLDDEEETRIYTKILHVEEEWIDHYKKKPCLRKHIEDEDEFLTYDISEVVNDTIAEEEYHRPQLPEVGDFTGGPGWIETRNDFYQREETNSVKRIKI